VALGKTRGNLPIESDGSQGAADFERGSLRTWRVPWWWYCLLASKDHGFCAGGVHAGGADVRMADLKRVGRKGLEF